MRSNIGMMLSSSDWLPSVEDKSEAGHRRHGGGLASLLLPTTILLLVLVSTVARRSTECSEDKLVQQNKPK